MSSRLAIKFGAALLAAALAGCSNDSILDRREGISLAAGEAQAANRVTQVIDFWPPYSANRNIAYNGERMQGAAERYRSHKVVQPISPITSSTDQPQPPAALTTEKIGDQNGSASAPPPPAAAVSVK
jgi:hypothetical protein